MIRFAVRRALASVSLLVLLSVATFGLFRLIPGDYLTEMGFQSSIPAEQIQRIREAYGLDQPVYVQYVRWVAQLSRGRLGYSFTQNRPAVDLILERFWNTFALAVVAMLMAAILSLPLGVIPALRAGEWPDQLALVLSLVALSLPTVVLALLFLYFAYWTGWYRLGGTAEASRLILPSLTLALPVAAVLGRLLRTGLLETFRQPFITAIAAKGVSRTRLLHHAIRNAVNPVLSFAGLTLGGMMSGAVVVERVFDWPGIGDLTVESILHRDLYVAVNCVVVAAAAFMVANFLAEILQALNDPRIRGR